MKNQPLPGEQAITSRDCETSPVVELTLKPTIASLLNNCLIDWEGLRNSNSWDQILSGFGGIGVEFPHNVTFKTIGSNQMGLLFYGSAIHDLCFALSHRTFLATPTHPEMTSVDQLPKPRRTVRTDREGAEKDALRNCYKVREYEPFSVPEAIAIRTVLLTRPSKAEEPTPHAAVEEVVAECTAVSEAVSPPNSVDYSSEQMSPTEE